MADELGSRREDPAWQRYWRYLTARFHAEVQDEVEFHLGERAKQLETEGLAPEAARREAERRFGDPGRIRARLDRVERKRGRRMTLSFMLGELIQDVRYGVRGLLKRPSFTLITATSLMLGIAVCTVVISVIDSWLLRPLPVPRAGELVVIGAGNRAVPMAAHLISRPTVRDIAARKDLFQDAAAVEMAILAVRPARAEQGQRQLLLATSGNYFTLLGVAAAAGRLYGPEDEVRRERMLVLDHRAWLRDFGGDPAVIGSTVYLNSAPFVVVGVTDPTFQGTEHLFETYGYLLSMAMAAVDPSVAGREDRRDFGRYSVIVRRRPGTSMAAIRNGLDLLARQLEPAYPELGEGYRFSAFPESRARPTLEAATWSSAASVIFGALGLLVLLTAAVNATNLILARGTARQTELAVRQALGASRFRVVRQLLTETMIIALIALAGGWALASLAVKALTSIPLGGAGLPLRWGIEVDWRVFGMAVLLTVGVGLIAGAGPAIAVSRFDLQNRLRQGARSGLGRRAQRFRGALVVLQVAGSAVVLISAGLLMASVRQAAKVDLGFHPDRVLTVGLDANLAHYDPTKARTAFDQIEHAVRAVAGVRGVAWANSVHLQAGRGVGGMAEAVALGAEQRTRKGTVPILTSAVSADFFSVVEMPLLEGRGFTIADDSAHPPVVIVNRQAAELLWPGQSPLGRTVRLTRDGPPVEVVGVVKTSKYLMIGERPQPFFYLPLAQEFTPGVFLFVKTEVDPALVIPAVKNAVATVDPDLVPFAVSGMRDMIETSLNGMLTLRVASTTASVIGGLAVILTCVGLYGLVAYSVTQRTREIGLRMAVGASRWMVVRSVLGEGGRLAGAGIVIGIGLALLTTRALAPFLVGVSVTDGATFLIVAAGLLLVTLGSAYLPARRAARIDPIKALKAEGGNGG